VRVVMRVRFTIARAEITFSRDVRSAGTSGLRQNTLLKSTPGLLNTALFRDQTEKKLRPGRSGEAFIIASNGRAYAHSCSAPRSAFLLITVASMISPASSASFNTVRAPSESRFRCFCGLRPGNGDHFSFEKKSVHPNHSDANQTIECGCGFRFQARRSLANRFTNRALRSYRSRLGRLSQRQFGSAGENQVAMASLQYEHGR